MVQAGVLERGVLGGPLPHPRGLQRLPPTTQQSTIGREYYSREEAGGGAVVWPPRQISLNLSGGSARMRWPERYSAPQQGAIQPSKRLVSATRV